MKNERTADNSSVHSIAVIGLGYVGLPLAVHLARARFKVTGVDINSDLVRALNLGERPNRDLPKEVFPVPSNLAAVTSPPTGCDVYIVCVPTPDRQGLAMDASFVIAACKEIGCVIPSGAIVVIESTVTPGATSGMLRNAVASTKGDQDFHIAFSPERVNPGSRYFYEMGNTEKLIGVDTDCVAALTEMYGRIFESVVTIGVTEAEIVKAFENSQRDMNIALMNELSAHCLHKGQDFKQVVRGLRTKKTSPVFNSGMVGGHCIPVDPYFLAEYYNDADCLTSHGRSINEDYIAKVAQLAIDCKSANGPILILGKTYKPGVVDQRNSGSAKVADYLEDAGYAAISHDPLIDPPYTGPRPTVVVGATNHNPNMELFDYYQCQWNCVFINIGGGFTDAQCAPFPKVWDI